MYTPMYTPPEYENPLLYAELTKIKQMKPCYIRGQHEQTSEMVKFEAICNQSKLYQKMMCMQILHIPHSLPRC